MELSVFCILYFRIYRGILHIHTVVCVLYRHIENSKHWIKTFLVFILIPQRSMFLLRLGVVCWFLVALSSLSGAQGRSKPKPDPKSKPKSKPKPRASFCEDRFSRNDLDLVHPVSCGPRAVCAVTSESVLRAVGSFDVAAALSSSAELDIRCIDIDTEKFQSAQECTNTYTNSDCTSGSICVATHPAKCLSACSDQCLETSDNEDDDSKTFILSDGISRLYLFAIIIS